MENTYHFNAATANLLQQQGWHAGRAVDVTRYVAAWNSEGYTASVAAKRFARCFGGLRLTHAAYRTAGQHDESVFDPVAAMNRLDSRWVKDCYEGLAGSSLCPIGSGYSQHMTYFIAERGVFYGGYDDYFCRIGRTVEEALHNILVVREFKPLGSDNGA